MKYFSVRLCALMAGVALLASCLSDDDDNASTAYSDVAITGFTLGTLNRYTHATSSATGNDTVVKTTISGTTYKLTIDQINRRIYNVKELPVGTDVAHVVSTVTTKNGGLVALQSAVSDSVRWFSSSDSVDYTSPRTLWVYSADGTSKRSYTVQLNVSTTTGINFAWEQVASLTTDDLASTELVAEADTVRLAGRSSIIGASTGESYMMDGDGHLLALPNGATDWLQERLDDDESQLPAPGQVACVTWPYASADRTDYVLLVGTPRQADVETMRVWRKIAPYEGGGTWVFMPVDDTNHYPMPRQESLVLAYYDGTVLAVGTDGVMRQSRDQGITWRAISTYALPDALEGTVVSMVADEAEGLWLLTDAGQLWRGALR